MLQENSLYDSPTARAALVADKERLMDALIFNYFGFLGLLKLSDRRNSIKTHLSTEKQLQPTNIGDDNHDSSLIVKLASEAKLIPQPVVIQMTKLLYLIKTRKVKGKDIDPAILMTYLARIRPLTNRPSAKVLLPLKRFMDGSATLEQMTRDLYRLAKLADYKAITTEFRSLVMKGQYNDLLAKVDQLAAAAAAPATPIDPVAAVNAATTPKAPATSTSAVTPTTQQKAEPKSQAAPQAAVSAVVSKPVSGSTSKKKTYRAITSMNKTDIEYLLPRSGSKTELADYAYRQFGITLKPGDADTHSFFFAFLDNMKAINLREYLSFVVISNKTSEIELVRTDAGKSFALSVTAVTYSHAMTQNGRVWKAFRGFVDLAPAGQSAFALSAAFIKNYKDSVRGMVVDTLRSAIKHNDFDLISQAVKSAARADWKELQANQRLWQEIETAIKNETIGAKLAVYLLDLVGKTADSVLRTHDTIWTLTPFWIEVLTDHGGSFGIQERAIRTIVELARASGVTDIDYDRPVKMVLSPAQVAKFEHQGAVAALVKQRIALEESGFEWIMKDALKSLGFPASRGDVANRATIDSNWKKPENKAKFETLVNMPEWDADDIGNKAMIEFTVNKSGWGWEETLTIFNIANSPVISGILAEFPNSRAARRAKAMFHAGKYPWREIQGVDGYLHGSALDVINILGVDTSPEGIIATTVGGANSEQRTAILLFSETNEITKWIDSLSSDELTEFFRNLNYLEFKVPVDTAVIKHLWSRISHLAPKDSNIITSNGFYSASLCIAKMVGTLESELRDDMLIGNPEMIEWAATTESGIYTTKNKDIQAKILDKMISLCDLNNKISMVKFAGQVGADARALGMIGGDRANAEEAALDTISMIINTLEGRAKDNPEINELLNVTYRHLTMSNNGLRITTEGGHAKRKAMISNTSHIWAAIFDEAKTGGDNISFLEPDNISFLEVALRDKAMTDDNRAKIIELLRSKLKPDLQADAAIIATALVTMFDNDQARAEAIFKDIKGELKSNIGKVFTNIMVLTNVADKIDNSPVRPLRKLDADRMAEVLTYNDIKLPTIDLRKMRSLASIRDMEVNADEIVKEQHVKIATTDTEETERLSVELDAFNRYKHGRISMLVHRVLDVNIPIQKAGFEMFHASRPDTEIMEPMFHGCGSIAASFILRFGFKVIKANDSSVVGRMLGDGIYMSNVLDKALQYVSDGGYTRGVGQRGYVFSMKAALGRRNEDYRDAHHTISPEWCVFNPNSQLQIKKAFEVEIVHSGVMRELKAKHKLEEAVVPLKMLKEYINTSDEPVVTYIFVDGQIPISETETVDFEDFKPAKFGPHVTLEPTGLGPMVVIRKPNIEDAAYVVRYNSMMADADRAAFLELLRK